MDHLSQIIEQYGIYAVFALCTVEGDITLLISGTMAHGGFFGPYSFLKVILFGTLGALAVFCLGLAFLMLIVSPTIFTVLLWTSAIAALLTLALAGVCVAQALAGRRYRIPIAGGLAERLAAR